jgi:hypothetical protein
MKPLTQTKFGTGGNCWMTCIASILEIPLEKCPDLTEQDLQETGAWHSKTQDFLTEIGYKKADFYPSETGVAPLGFSIASGQGPRGYFHACVALNGEIVHDPHPDRSGLLSIREFSVLLPLVHSSTINLPLHSDFQKAQRKQLPEELAEQGIVSSMLRRIEREFTRIY